MLLEIGSYILDNHVFTDLVVSTEITQIDQLRDLIAW